MECGLPVLRPAWTSSRNVSPRSQPHPRRYSGSGSRKIARARRPGRRRRPEAALFGGRLDAARQNFPPPSPPRTQTANSHTAKVRLRCTARGESPAGFPEEAGSVAYWLSGALAVAAALRALLTYLVGDVLRGPAVMNGSARGPALVVLVVGVPVLACSLVLARRGSPVAVVTLWRRKPRGYLLGGASIVMGATESISIAADPVSCAVLLQVSALWPAASADARARRRWPPGTRRLRLAGRRESRAAASHRTARTRPRSGPRSSPWSRCRPP